MCAARPRWRPDVQNLDRGLLIALTRYRWDEQQRVRQREQHVLQPKPLVNVDLNLTPIQFNNRPSNPKKKKLSFRQNSIRSNPKR
jgi:hypothetical protein